MPVLVKQSGSAGRLDGDRAARRDLRDQIARLEGALSALFAQSWPRQGLDFSVGPVAAGGRLLTLGELEAVRDALAVRVEQARRAVRERTAVERHNRDRIEQMLRAPAEHKWERISNADLGAPGCRHWHVRPRWGPLGMLANWWRVNISSGCPLGQGHGATP